MKIKASIIITNYNYSRYIERSIKSCVSQNFDKKKFEIIIIDDCSSDDSLKKIKYLKKKYSSYNIKYEKNKVNLGVAASSNVGILKSRGEYITRLDSDDYISKNFLNFMTFFLDEFKNNLGVCCDYYYVSNSGNKLKKVNYVSKPISCAVMYRRKKLLKFGIYNRNLKHREEEELRARLGAKYIIGYLNLPLYRYRMHSTNKTKSSEYKITYRKLIINLKKDYAKKK
jgi:glycosyltransferase involved in cell wall biosynthesis